MKIDEELLLPYSLSIGIWNILCTVIALTICYFVFNIPITQSRIIESYLIGYIILFILNLELIKE